MSEVPSSDPKTHPAVAQGSLLLIGGLLGRILLYGVHLVLAWMLPADALGDYFLAMAVLQGLVLCATLGLDTALLRALSQAPRSQTAALSELLRGAWGLVLVITLALGGLLYGLASPLAALLHSPGLEAVLVMAALPLLALTCHRMLASLLQARLEFQALLGLRYVLYPTALLLLIPLLAWLEPSARMAVAAQGGAAALAILLSRYGRAEPHPIRAMFSLQPTGSSPPSTSSQELPAAARSREASADPDAYQPAHAQAEPASVAAALGALLRFSLPLLIAALVGYGGQWLDTLLVGYYLPSEQVAVYGVVTRISLVALLLLEAFNSTLSPPAAALHTTGRASPTLQQLYSDTTRVSLLLYLPFLATCLCLPELILGIFGDAYRGESACLALRLLSLGQLINVAVGGCGALLVMGGRTRLQLVNGIAMLATSTALCLWWIPLYGLVGAAGAAACAISFVNLIRLLEVYALWSLRPSTRGWWKAALMFAAVGTALELTRTHVTSVGLMWMWWGLTLLVYGLGLVALGLEPAERALLTRVLARTRP